MLRLSKKVDCAIVALAHLSKTQSSFTARELAKHFHFPPQMLANVLKKMASCGLLVSKRGFKGGYMLARESHEIVLGDIIRCIEGPLNFSNCSNHKTDCNIQNFCPVHESLHDLFKKIETMFDNLSLNKIIKN